MVSISVELILGEGDAETAALLRESTALLASGREDEAIDCLYKARDRMMVSIVHYPHETWCKLPLYLSRIGRFDEAMAAFDWLINDIPRRARKESFMDNPTFSFGKDTPKKTVHNAIIKNLKRTVEAKRSVVLRRKARFEKSRRDQ